MLVSCPFCSNIFVNFLGQLLIQAYIHVQLMYGVCFNCFRHIVKHFRILDFQRVSVFKDKGIEKLKKLKKANQQLKNYLETNMVNFSQAVRKHVVEQYFDRIGDCRKSQQSTISTSPSLGCQADENPQHNSKLIAIKPRQAQIKVQQSSTVAKLSIIKEKLTSTGISLIQKIKESERYQKQVENMANYKEKILQRSDVVRNKLSKIKSDFKEIKSELPSLKEAVKGMEVGSMIKSKLFGRW